MLYDVSKPPQFKRLDYVHIVMVPSPDGGAMVATLEMAHDKSAHVYVLGEDFDGAHALIIFDKENPDVCFKDEIEQAVKTTEWDCCGVILFEAEHYDSVLDKFQLPTDAEQAENLDEYEEEDKQKPNLITFDDPSESFAHGFECGKIWMLLATKKPLVDLVVFTANETMITKMCSAVNRIAEFTPYTMSGSNKSYSLLNTKPLLNIVK